MITPGSTIEIQAASNGFIVMGDKRDMVFPDFYALIKWLEGHFGDEADRQKNVRPESGLAGREAGVPK